MPEGQIDTRTIIFTPKNGTYNGSLQEVAEKYSRLFMKGYFDLIHHVQPDATAQADYQEVVGQKEGLDLKVEVFYDHPVEGVGAQEDPFNVTHYLFTLETDVDITQTEADEDVLADRSKKGPIYLPDFEAIQISGKENLDSAVDRLCAFYDMNGWKSAVLPEGDNTYQTVPSEREDLDGKSIDILRPEHLIQAAEKELGYDNNTFCFGLEDSPI
jgi:hypothetical protein